MAMQRVPQVDLRRHAAGGAEREAFVRELGAALEALGFVIVTGHGVDHALIEQAYAVVAELFALPEAVKRRYETPEDGRQRGYTSFGVEHARDHDQPDLKEFWHVGRSDAPAGARIPPNQWPAELPAVQSTFTALFTALESAADEILAAVGRHLGLSDDFFADCTRHGNSVLRLIHYPDVAAAIPGAVRAAAHEDINLITLLPASTRPGLQLLTRDGDWMAVDAPEGALICDTGDMMQLLTGGQLPATTHRVVNPPRSDGGRYSMPFFVHPRPDFLIEPLRSCGRQAMTAEAFLTRRLRETGVS